MRDLSSLMVEPRPSRSLLLGGGASHVLASAAVIVSSIPWWIKAGFIVGIALSLAWFGYCHGYPRGRRFIVRVELLNGRWRLESGDSVEHWARLTDGYAHPLVIILNFRLEEGRPQSLVLLPDSADADALRRMRVWLRTRSPDEVEPEPP